MKIATIIARVLLGLMFMFASVVYFLDLVPQPEVTGALKTFNEGLGAAVYLMPLVKTIEFLCALAFVTGRFVALAAVVLLPITVNIMLVNVYLAPEGMFLGIAVFILNVFLLFAYRQKYSELVAAK
jgi:uncharacterized membrane protein YphA (DoxX/SURF4 family)